MECVKFPGDYASLENIAEYFRTSACQAGLSSFDIYAVETAVDEACSNIIEHGFKNLRGGEIECCYQVIDKGFKIILIDHGRPFNPAEIPFPDMTKSLDEREAHGLGLYFIRKWMDEFYYESDPVKGNRMEMVKYREGLVGT